MRLTDADKATAAQELAGEVMAMIAAKPGIPDADLAGIATGASVAVAMSFAALRCVDQASAIGLIHVLAESVAADIYGSDR